MTIDKNKTRNDMEKILEKLNEYYPQNEDYNKDLAKELCVLLGVSSISLEQLKLQKECYKEGKERNGKSTAYGEAYTDQIREGVIDHLIALCNYR